MIQQLPQHLAMIAKVVKTSATKREAILHELRNTLRSLKGQNNEIEAKEVLFNQMLNSSKITESEYFERMSSLKADMSAINMQIAQVTVQFAYN